MPRRVNPLAFGRRRVARTRRRCFLTLLLLLVAASPSQANPPAPETADEEKSGEASRREAPGAEVPGLDADGTYLRPNAPGNGGAPYYVHVTPADMPWRVAVGTPKRAPRGGTTEDARLAAIEAMRAWEQAIQPHLSWFQLEFVDDETWAPVQFVWELQSENSLGGFGQARYRIIEGRIQVGGELHIATTPDHFSRLTVDELRALVTHEFGHVLGLKHCVECDSAMHDSWYTRDRIEVTETDVRTFLKLVAQPNGPVAPTRTRSEPE